ncbi:MAG: ABC transporter ATP-binding protein [Lachnospiraceae bacterium]|nr:ABC transporter ATP-binding protein [Lachnospiraceae bacterium]
MSRIELKHIDKFYGKNHILKDVDLTIEDGDFMTLLGPSGCGKTTTLRVVSGLEKPQHGTIHMDGKEIVNALEAHFEPPSKRGLNLVFQSYALWPHMTVRENIAFGLNLKKLPKDEVNRKVMDSLKRMQIDQYVDRYPSELSGGQQQRVAIARAISSEPDLLLLDEPLSNLDAKLRVDMRTELKRLHTETKTTMIYVTHDQTEALTMSTKIALFRMGEIVQIGKPLDLYKNPKNLYVADFIGSPRMNLIDAKAEVDASGLHLNSILGKMDFPASLLTDECQKSGSFDAVIGIRSEHMEIRTSRMAPSDVEARVYISMPEGSETLNTVSVADQKLVVKSLGITDYAADEDVYLSINLDKINVFDKKSENLIKYSV